MCSPECHARPLAPRGEDRGDALQETLASCKEVGEVTFTSFVRFFIYSFDSSFKFHHGQKKAVNKTAWVPALRSYGFVTPISDPKA